MEREQIKTKINHIPNHQNTNRIFNICPGLDLLFSSGFLSLKGWVFFFRSLLSTIIYLYYHLPRGLCQKSSHVLPAYSSYCLALIDKGSNSAWSLHRITCYTWASDVISTVGLFCGLNGVWMLPRGQNLLHLNLEATVWGSVLTEKGCYRYRQR